MTEITKQDVLDLLWADSPEDMLNFFHSLPRTTMSDAARGLVVSSHPGIVLVALSTIAQEYAYGSNPGLGATLASALHERAWELWESTPDHDLVPTTLSGLASSHVKALSLLGRNGEILEVTEDYIPRYEELGEKENLPALYVLRLEALVTEERFDEAAKELEDHVAVFKDIDKNAIWGMELRRLKRRIDKARGSAVELAGQVGGAPLESPAEDMLQGLVTVLGDDAGGLADQLKDLVTTGQSLDPSDADDFAALGRVLKQGEDFLSRGGGADTELTIRGKIREASGIFVHGTPSRDRILESLGDLEHSLAWATEHGIRELENDANWGLYLCYSRLEQPSEAADALIGLRTGLERRRAGIQDPLERAGIFGDYRYLFHSLCEKLHQAGRGAELLQAIESSKGRAIADKLTQKEGAPVEDSAIYECVGRLPELTQAEGFHYLTYFVDDERVYAVLVDKTGEIHVPDPIEVSRPVLQEAALTVDPQQWGRIRSHPGDTYPPANETLAPMVSWISDLVDRGVVARDDHLVYSPDEEFHNVPLHYLRFRDEIVLDWLSVSRVQTAFEIANLLGTDALRPKRFVGFVVPSQEDVARKDDGKMVAAFRAPVEWLEARMEGEVASMEEATVSQVQDQSLDAAIVHFSTHGVFPEGGNPFESSFLLMADGSGLPATATEVPDEGRLTPAKVLERGEGVSRSHVSMMACVSGRAAEGIGGDALGLDWSFLQTGASSLISTHWNVSAAAAATFFVRFYEKWLEDGRSRSQAFREAMLELMDGDRDEDSLGSWAAFSLTGDFR